MMIGGETGRRQAPRSDLRDAGARRRRHPAHARPREGRAAPPSRATCTAARTAPATSSRWSTTASSTASWPPTPRGSASCATPTSASTTHASRRRDDAAARSRALPVRLQSAPTSPRCGGAAASIASWLLDLTAIALVEDPALADFAGRVSDSGEGRWTIKAAIDEAVPAPVLTAALYERFSSRGEADFQDKLLSAMRYRVRRPPREAGRKSSGAHA